MVSSTALLLWWFVSPCSAGLFVGFFPLPSSDVQVCPSVFVCFATLVDTMKKQNQCCGIASNVICYAFFRLASIARMVRSRASSLWAFGKRVRKCVCVSVCCVWSGMALQTTHRHTDTDTNGETDRDTQRHTEAETETHTHTHTLSRVVLTLCKGA